MKSTQAAVLRKIGEPLEVLEIELPELKRGQILVKVFYSGICRSQLMEMTGGRGEDPWLPHLLGHEGSGQVIAIGDGVKKVAVDDEVVLTWIKCSGIDADGAVYKSSIGNINAGRVTTLARYTVVSESRLALKPKCLANDIAALYGCAIPTGAGMVLNEIKPNQDSVCLVYGLGGIGISALAMLKAMNVKKIIAIDSNSEKLKLAISLGAHLAIDATNKNFEQAVLAEIDQGVDYCIESCGTVETIERGYSFIRKFGGKLIFASHPPHGGLIRINPHDLISGKNIQGTWGGNVYPDRDISSMSELFMLKKVDLNVLITRQYSLEQVNEAFYDLERGAVFRPIINMENIFKN